jgi:hypothetical protein
VNSGERRKKKRKALLGKKGEREIEKKERKERFQKKKREKRENNQPAYVSWGQPRWETGDMYDRKGKGVWGTEMVPRRRLLFGFNLWSLICTTTANDIEHEKEQMTAHNWLFSGPGCSTKAVYPGLKASTLAQQRVTCPVWKGLLVGSKPKTVVTATKRKR